MNKAAGLLAALMALPATLVAQDFELRLGEATGRPGAATAVPLTLSSVAEVQGVVAVFEWDAAVATGQDLMPAASVELADTVVMRVEPAFMVFGVVMDADGQDGEVIPPGAGIEIATARLVCNDAAEESSTPLAFVDAKYASVDGGPLLDNLVSVGGLSITNDPAGGAQVLALASGLLTCRPATGLFFEIVDAEASPETGCGVAAIRMDNSVDIEAYELAVAHPDSLNLDAIEVGAAAVAAGADFSQSELVAGGGTLGVIMDLTPPFDGNVIPPGVGQEIARFRYCCALLPGPDDPPEVFALTFVDGQLGQPAKENAGVSLGRTVAPTLQSATFTCPPRGVAPAVGQTFACGTSTLGGDGIPATPVAQLGGEVDVCFYYKSEEDNVPGGPQFDQVQGISMAVRYPCELQCQEGSFDIAGTIVEAIGADFVSHQCDNDADDGDGCELIIGILVDSVPPFDGRTLPPTDTFLSVGCLTFSVTDSADACGQCLPVRFSDGVNGRGDVPIRNLVSVENQSRTPQLIDCEVCLVGEAVFHRGDCNFSNVGALSVDIADPAALISFLFLEGQQRFDPPCLDACDCNDDGRLDLADANCLLEYLFLFGPFPPPPGPGIDLGANPTPPGPDPTDDLLDCAGGTACL